MLESNLHVDVLMEFKEHMKSYPFLLLYDRACCLEPCERKQLRQQKSTLNQTDIYCTTCSPTAAPGTNTLPIVYPCQQTEQQELKRVVSAVSVTELQMPRFRQTGSLCPMATKKALTVIITSVYFNTD